MKKIILLFIVFLIFFSPSILSFNYSYGNITYNDLYTWDSNSYMSITYYDVSAVKYSKINGLTNNFDYFNDTATTGDYIMWCWTPDTNLIPSKVNGIQLNVGTKINSTGLKLDWQYWNGGDTTSRFGLNAGSWSNFSNVVVSPSSALYLNKTGIVNITWNIPEDWGTYYRPDPTQGDYYRYCVRALLTTTGMIEGGRQTTQYTKLFSNMIISNKVDITPDILYLADQAEGWNKIKSFDNKTFFINSSLGFVASNLTLKGKLNIIMGRNFVCHATSSSLLFVGETLGGFSSHNGATIQELFYAGKHISAWGGFKNTNSKMYDYNIKVVQLPVRGYIPDNTTSYSDWGAIYGSYNQASVTGYRSVAFSDGAFYTKFRSIRNNVDGEPVAGYLYDVDISGGNNPTAMCARTTSAGYKSHNIIAWQCNIPIEAYGLTGQYYLVDWDTNISAFNQDIWGSTGNTGAFNILYTLLIKVVDVNNTPIKNINLSIFNNNSILYLNLTSLSDGFFGLDGGNVTSSSDTSLTDTSKSWSNHVFRNYKVYLTSGSGNGQERVIYGNWGNILFVWPSWTIIPDNTTKYIIVPEFTHSNYSTTDNINTTIKYSSPYTFIINNSAYELFNFTIDVNKKRTLDIILYQNETEGEVNKMYIAMILGILGFSAILLIFALNLEQKHNFLRLLLILVIIFIQIITGRYVQKLSEGTILEGVGDTFYKAVLTFIILFCAYLFIYFIYNFLEETKKLPNFIKKYKQKI